ncbi:hypothetical protein MIR68_012168 [Amoeboaphelidium protococcarum]|nr:hypothetical protein MIR68_012168 [Amoeboaphelidium protococcarum]
MLNMNALITILLSISIVAANRQSVQEEIGGQVCRGLSVAICLTPQGQTLSDAVGYFQSKKKYSQSKQEAFEQKCLQVLSRFCDIPWDEVVDKALRFAGEIQEDLNEIEEEYCQQSFFRKVTYRGVSLKRKFQLMSLCRQLGDGLDSSDSEIGSSVESVDARPSNVQSIEHAYIPQNAAFQQYPGQSGQGRNAAMNGRQSNVFASTQHETRARQQQQQQNKYTPEQQEYLQSLGYQQGRPLRPGRSRRPDSNESVPYKGKLIPLSQYCELRQTRRSRIKNPFRTKSGLTDEQKSTLDKKCDVLNQIQQSSAGKSRLHKRGVRSGMSGLAFRAASSTIEVTLKLAIKAIVELGPAGAKIGGAVLGGFADGLIKVIKSSLR